MPETVPIRPADLLIDEQNPRIAQPNTGQHRALQALAQRLGRKLQVLAADIVRYGLNPTDLPIVMPLAGNAGRYVVLEGNRRLAALRALETPESLVDATTPGVLKQIRRLSRAYQENPIEAVTCSVVKDRDEARHWIELRHTGENLGAGIVPWGSDEAARFRARTGSAAIHSQALDFLQRRGDLTAEARSKVPATSLKRLIETPEVRSKLGVEVENGTLYLLADEKRVAKALMYIVNNLTKGTTKVGDIYTKKQRLVYADKFPAEVVVAPTIKSGEGVPAGTGIVTAKPKSGTAARSPKKRDRLIPRDCVLSIPNGRIRDIEIELRKLSLEEHTNAISVLFRVFIELSGDSYIEGNALGVSQERALQIKLGGVVDDLIAKKKLTRKQATPVRRACQRDSFLAPSVSLMHEYVHNPHVFPAPGDQRAHWDSLQPFIAAMWTP
jgi:hypothetical protein